MKPDLMEYIMEDWGIYEYLVVGIGGISLVWGTIAAIAALFGIVDNNDQAK